MRQEGKWNTYPCNSLYVFRLTNPTPEKYRWLPVRIDQTAVGEKKKQTLYDYTWPCKRMSGSQVMGNCVGRVLFFSGEGGLCVPNSIITWNNIPHLITYVFLFSPSLESNTIHHDVAQGEFDRSTVSTTCRRLWSTVAEAAEEDRPEPWR